MNWVGRSMVLCPGKSSRMYGSISRDLKPNLRVVRSAAD